MWRPTPVASAASRGAAVIRPAAAVWGIETVPAASRARQGASWSRATREWLQEHHQLVRYTADKLAQLPGHPLIVESHLKTVHAMQGLPCFLTVTGSSEQHMPFADPAGWPHADGTNIQGCACWGQEKFWTFATQGSFLGARCYKTSLAAVPRKMRVAHVWLFCDDVSNTYLCAARSCNTYKNVLHTSLALCRV